MKHTRICNKLHCHVSHMHLVGQTQNTHQTQNRQGHMRIASATALARASAGTLLSCVAMAATAHASLFACPARRRRFLISNASKFKFLRISWLLGWGWRISAVFRSGTGTKSLRGSKSKPHGLPLPRIDGAVDLGYNCWIYQKVPSEVTSKYGPRRLPSRVFIP